MGGRKLDFLYQSKEISEVNLGLEIGLSVQLALTQHGY